MKEEKLSASDNSDLRKTMPHCLPIPCQNCAVGRCKPLQPEACTTVFGLLNRGVEVAGMCWGGKGFYKTHTHTQLQMFIALCASVS